jgi:hypothetical protein
MTAAHCAGSLNGERSRLKRPPGAWPRTNPKSMCTSMPVLLVVQRPETDTRRHTQTVTCRHTQTHRHTEIGTRRRTRGNSAGETGQHESQYRTAKAMQCVSQRPQTSAQLALQQQQQQQQLLTHTSQHARRIRQQQHAAKHSSACSTRRREHTPCQTRLAVPWGC